VALGTSANPWASLAVSGAGSVGGLLTCTGGAVVSDLRPQSANAVNIGSSSAPFAQAYINLGTYTDVQISHYLYANNASGVLIVGNAQSSTTAATLQTPQLIVYNTLASPLGYALKLRNMQNVIAAWTGNTVRITFNSYTTAATTNYVVSLTPYVGYTIALSTKSYVYPTSYFEAVASAPCKFDFLCFCANGGILAAGTVYADGLVTSATY
jgi:hypothetical protein